MHELIGIIKTANKFTFNMYTCIILYFSLCFIIRRRKYSMANYGFGDIVCPLLEGFFIRPSNLNCRITTTKSKITYKKR